MITALHPTHPTQSARHLPDSGWDATLFVWSVWALMLLAALAFVWHYGFRIPHADDFLSTVPVLVGIQPVTPTWFWTFEDSDHRIPLPKLVLLVLYELTGWDYHAAAFVNPILLGGLALALIQVAKRVRGWQRYSDAIFPITLLQCGPGAVFLWGSMIQFVLSVCLLGILLLIIIRPIRLSLRATVLAGTCILLLPTCGANGVGMVPMLVLWLGYVGFSSLCSPERCSKRPAIVALAFAVAALLLVGFYFLDFHFDRDQYTPPERWREDFGSLWDNAPKYIPTSPSWGATLRASVQFLTMGFGAHLIRPYWKPFSLIVLSLLLTNVVILVVVWCKRRQERSRASGLLLVICGVVCLAIGIGYGRAAGGDLFDQGRYAVLAVPMFWCTYFVWEIYVALHLARFAQMVLLLLTCIFVPLNIQQGHEEGKSCRELEKSLERDIRSGFPSFILAERYQDMLFAPSGCKEITQKEKDLWAEILRELRDVGHYPFGLMRRDPACRMVSLPIMPTAMADLKTKAGTFQGSGQNAYLLFTLPKPQFVYAIRLKYSYDQGSADCQGSFRLLWRESVRNSFRETERTSDLPLERQPGEKSGTVWVNDTVDQFRIQPVMQPCVFHLVEIVLLVPSADKGPMSGR